MESMRDIFNAEAYCYTSYMADYGKELYPIEVSLRMSMPAGTTKSGTLKGRLSRIRITGKPRIKYYIGCSQCSKSVLEAKLSGPTAIPICQTESCTRKRLCGFNIKNKPYFKTCLMIEDFSISGEDDGRVIIRKAMACNEEAEILLGLCWEDNPADDESLLRILRTTTYDLEVCIISSESSPPRCVFVRLLCATTDPLPMDFPRPYKALQPEPYILTPPDEETGVGGECMIINITEFDHNVHERRSGSELDVQNLQRCFNEIGIHSLVEEDVRSDQLSGVMDRFKERVMEAGARSCFLVIMSHGWNDGIVMADNVICDLWTEFVDALNDDKFEEFKGLPKFVFSQACQSFRASYYHNASVLTCDSVSNASVTRDTLVSTATSPGFNLMKDPQRGSPYIRAICNQFQEALRYPHLELEYTEIRKVMDRVNNEVRIRNDSTFPNTQFVQTTYSDLRPFYFQSLPG